MAIQFGIKPVMSGQKNVASDEKTLTVNSTAGKFTLSAMACKFMGILAGENVQFINNISNIEEEIVNRSEGILEMFAADGLNIDEVADQQAFIKKYAAWYIAKGIIEMTAKGQVRMCAERTTNEEKLEVLKEQKATLLVKLAKELKERAVKAGDFTEEDEMTDEELASYLTVEDVPSKTTEAYSGSKTATTARGTGFCKLQFTDSNVWRVLRGDLEDGAPINRIYEVNVADAETVELNNGYSEVEVKVFPITFEEDVPVTSKKETK